LSNHRQQRSDDEKVRRALEPLDLGLCARFLGRKEEAYQQMRESFVNGDVAFLGWLPDGPSLQIFKPDPEFQAILGERDKHNAGKRARILAIEKSYQ
jgi:hypothetical protein